MAITAMRTAQAFLPRALELPPRTYAATSGAGRYFYHSDDLKSRTPFSHAQSAILSNALAHVPTHGFTSSALSAGVRDAGYPDVSINLLTRGPFDLVHYHLVQQRLSLPRLVGVVDDKLDEWMRVRAILVRRLYANGNVVSRWTEALALMAQPSHASTAVNELFMLSGGVWFLAGDVSSDTTWYAKRAMLAAIYSSTELFMTRDTSPEFFETMKFLDRRLEEAGAVGGAVSNVETWLGFAAQASVNVLRSKGFRI